MGKDIVLGDWVEDIYNHNKGRVYAKHHNFFDSGESLAWFDSQIPHLNYSDVANTTWYSVLCHDGGAISAPEKNIKKTDSHPAALLNVWNDFYFGDK